MNIKYIISFPGISKLGTLFIGLIAIGLGGYAHRNSVYLQEKSSIRKASCQQRDLYVKARNKTEYDTDFKPCPWDLLPVFYIMIVVLSWVASIVGLIVFITVDLKKGMNTMIDFSGHLVGGVFMFIAAIMAIVFAAQAFRDFNCDGIEKYHAKLNKPFDYGLLCKLPRRSKYQPEVFIAGGVFATINGLVYIVTGTLVLKQD